MEKHDLSSHPLRHFLAIGYLPKENRIYLGDKEMNVISYALLLSVMEYQVIYNDLCLFDFHIPPD